jgi:hypothetical protein
VVPAHERPNSPPTRRRRLPHHASTEPM